MFSDDPNITQLAEKIFWYKGFLTPEEMEPVNKAIKESTSKKHYFKEIEFRPMDHMFELKPIWDKVSEFLYPEFVIHPLLNMIEFPEGTQMLPHCDSPGEGHDDDLTVPDLWSTCCILSWGVCTYFGEWEGGEIYYPNQDVTIDVKPGDLVIHGALKDCEHGVRTVTKGTRYTYSNFSLRADKNPGTFPNYKTPEYEKAMQDGLGSWLLPLKENPLIVKTEFCPKCGSEKLENVKCPTCYENFVKEQETKKNA
jgi:hypothetical protein